MDAWIPVVLAVVGSGGILTLIVTGVGKWISRRRDEQVADKLADLTEIKNLRKQIFDMQQERIQYEMTRRESSDQTMKVLTAVLSRADQSMEILEAVRELLKSTKGGTPA